jgi:hypothetical protein
MKKTMTRTTEKLKSLTGRDLSYDGKEHSFPLSDFASSLEEYTNRLKNCDVCVKSKTFGSHLNTDPIDINVLSFSDINSDMICYVLLYKGSLSPLFVSGDDS